MSIPLKSGSSSTVCGKGRTTYNQLRKQRRRLLRTKERIRSIDMPTPRYRAVAQGSSVDETLFGESQAAKFRR